jgi:hypothetical protein
MEHMVKLFNEIRAMLPIISGDEIRLTAMLPVVNSRKFLDLNSRYAVSS